MTYVPKRAKKNTAAGTQEGRWRVCICIKVRVESPTGVFIENLGLRHEREGLLLYITLKTLDRAPVAGNLPHMCSPGRASVNRTRAALS